MESAIALLQAAIALLTLLLSPSVMIPDDLRTQAAAVANQAVIIANVEIAKSQAATSPITNPTPTPMPENSTPAPAPTSPAAAEPVSQARIEIINPSPNKGLGRNYKANDYQMNNDGTLKAGSVAPDESNSVYLGAVLYAADGSPVKDADMSITVGTSTPVVLNGTGNMTKIYVNGAPQNVPFYPFNYEFRKSGHITFVFEAQGLSKSVELDVQ